MKKIIFLSALFILSCSLFAEHRVQFSLDKDVFSVYAEENAPTFTDGFHLFPLHAEGGSLSYIFEFPSKNRLHWLIGGDVGWNAWGANICGQGGASISLYQSEDANFDLQFLTKFGFLFHLYNQVSVDFIVSHKKNHTFFYGLGLHNSARAIFFSKDAKYKFQKACDQIGFQVFCGYKF